MNDINPFTQGHITNNERRQQALQGTHCLCTCAYAIDCFRC